MVKNDRIYFVIVNGYFSPPRDWPGGKPYGLNYNFRTLPIQQQIDYVNRLYWCLPNGVGHEYESLANAKKCPAWLKFKHMPHIYIEERHYMLQSTKIHDFSSVKVELS